MNKAGSMRYIYLVAIFKLVRHACVRSRYVVVTIQSHNTKCNNYKNYCTAIKGNTVSYCNCFLIDSVVPLITFYKYTNFTSVLTCVPLNVNMK